MQTGYQRRNRADKIRLDKMSEDKDGVAPRLNELIKWTRWSCYLLAGIVGMVALFFVRDAVQAIISLF